MKKLTMAELKRLAKQNVLTGEMTYWYGRDIPARLQGKRKIIDSNSNSITFLNADGKKSKLYLDNANLIDFTEETLDIYNFGERPFNEKEQEALNEWKKITETEEYQKQLEYDMLTDYNACYYKQKRFWQDKNMNYMFYDWQGGLLKDYNKDVILDKHIKGEKLISYKIERAV